MLNLAELLQPIPGPSPGGADLRYEPISAQIREARRFEDELEQGVWKREVKKADYALVIRLATEALRNRGKDLQVAAWLTEALTHEYGYEGLRQGLELVSRLLERFWETLHPGIDEDGDLELRATPLAWIATQLDRVIRSVPLTADGYSWLDYRFAQTIPTEAQAASDETSRAIRQDAIDRHRPTVEAFEESCQATPIAFYERLREELAGAQAQLEELAKLVDEKFGEFAPSFGPLRSQLEEMEQTVRVILVKRREQEAARLPPQEAPAPMPASSGPKQFTDDWGQPPGPAAVEPEPLAEPAQFAPEPAQGPLGCEEAILRVAQIAETLRQNESGHPLPYLLLRAARWAELYYAGSDPSGEWLEAPPTQVRIELKHLWQQGDWPALLESTERAMATPCGRAWLDLQRYAIEAAERLGLAAVSRALRSALRALLRDYPSLPDRALNDDTPAAGPETKSWLEEQEVRRDSAGALFDSVPQQAAPDRDGGTGEPPDVFEIALEAVRARRPAEALAAIARQARLAACGRDRFLRRIQLAEICLATGNEAIALPVLEQLEREIEERRLEEWEAEELVAQPLAMLFQCLRSSENPERRRLLYARLCRLDPVRALALAR